MSAFNITPLNPSHLQQELQSYKDAGWKGKLQEEQPYTTIELTQDVAGMYRIGLLFTSTLKVLFTLGRNQNFNRQLQDVWNGRCVVWMTCNQIANENVTAQFNTIFRANQVTPAASNQVQAGASIVSNRGMTFPAGSRIAYYSHRRGFPNPHRHCHFNSMAVVYAYTGFQLTASIHPQNEKLAQELNACTDTAFEAAVNQKRQTLQAQLAAKKAELQNISDQHRANQQLTIARLQQDVTHLENEHRHAQATEKAFQEEHDLMLISANHDIKAATAAQTILEQNENKKDLITQSDILLYQIAIHKQTMIIHECRLLIEKLQETKTTLQGQTQKALKNLQTKQAELKAAAKTNTTDDALAAEIQDIETQLKSLSEALEAQTNLERAKRVLGILRGECQGNLTDFDAPIVCQAIGIDIDVNTRTPLYKGRLEFQEDKNRDRLKEAFADPNWRVLRVGGHDHWWTYVRNANGSVTKINDRRVSDPVKIETEFQDFFTNPEKWTFEQITFYDGIPQ